MCTVYVVPLREDGVISAMLAQNGLVESGQPGKDPVRYSATAGN